MTTTRGTPTSAGHDDYPGHGPGARDERYDVVVIGAGMGGLTAAAVLARAGKKVLVVESEAAPGGYTRAMRRGPYVFDWADHLIWGCAPHSPFGPGLIDSVLRHLGVRDRCTFVRMDEPIYVAKYPDFTLEIPRGRDAYLDAYLRHFPAEKAGLQRLVDISAEVAREVPTFPVNPRAIDMALIARRYPALFRYRNATMKDLIDRELADPRLKAAYASLWAWVGPPPSQASFLMWACMMANYVEDGAYYCRGSFQSLADAFAVGLERAGGELALRTRATHILTEAGRARGVTLDTGQTISAPLVISNIDARDTFGSLLSADEVNPRFLRRLRELQLSHSIAALYAATDLDVSAVGSKHDTGVVTDWDHDRSYARALVGELTLLSVVIPTLKDPSLAPAGEHLVILKTIAPRRITAGSLDGDLADRMLELADKQVLPGLRDHLTYVDVDASVSESGSRLQLLGPYSGWSVVPRQTAARRLPQRTPVAGLVLAGQWTRPANGVWTVVQSGLGAAALALGRKSTAPVP